MKQRPLVMNSELNFYDPKNRERQVDLGLDVLKLIGLNTQSKSEPDFRIKMIENPSYGNSYSLGTKHFYISFNGEGGIQKIESKDIKFAPENGYEKDLEVSPGIYVTRLRDGKHYMILEWKGNNDLPGSPIVWLYIKNSGENYFNFLYENSYYYGVTNEMDATGDKPHSLYTVFDIAN